MSDLKPCPFCGQDRPINTYVGMCETCYNDSNRCRYYTKGDQVWQEIPGNNICICTGTHGEADVTLIANALNAWQVRYRRAPRFSPEETEAMKRAIVCLHLTPDTGGMYSSTEDDDLAAAVLRRMIEDENTAR